MENTNTVTAEERAEWDALHQKLLLTEKEAPREKELREKMYPPTAPQIVPLQPVALLSDAEVEAEHQRINQKIAVTDAEAGRRTELRIRLHEIEVAKAQAKANEVKITSVDLKTKAVTELTPEEMVVEHTRLQNAVVLLADDAARRDQLRERMAA